MGKLDATMVVNGPEGDPAGWGAVDWRAAEENVRRPLRLAGHACIAAALSFHAAAQIAHCKRHEVLNGSGRRPASCPAMLPAVTAG